MGSTTSKSTHPESDLSSNRKQSSRRYGGLLIAGTLLIAAALWLRSSAWMREAILRGRDTAELETMVAVSPKDPIARYHLAKSYYLARRFGDAAREYREVRDLDSKSARAEIGLGLSLFELGDRRGSRMAFERALTLDERSAWAEYMLAKLSWSEGDVNSALEHARRSTELDERSDQAWYGLAACYTQLRKYQPAITALKNSVDRNPNNYKAHAALGELLIYRGKADEGVNHLERALELNPNDPVASVLLGQHLASIGSDPATLKRAEELLRKAFQLKSPRGADTQLDLGRLLARRGALEEALAHFEAARKLEPGDERVYYALADVLRRMGRKAEANDHEKKFRELSRRHVRLQQLEARVGHSPADASARIELARLYQLMGRPKSAAAQYAKYIELRPDDQAAQREAKQLASRAAPTHGHSSDFSFSPLPIRP